MINVLPPEVKTDIRYSKLNVTLLRYSILVIIVGVILFSSFELADRLAAGRVDNASQQLDNRQEIISEFKNLETDVATLENKLNLINTLLSERPRFSLLLQDLAQALPQGSYITSIALDGDASEPLEITLNAQSYEQAGVVRNALADTTRFTFVDILNVTKDDATGDFRVELTAAFAEGQAQ